MAIPAVFAAPRCSDVSAEITKLTKAIINGQIFDGSKVHSGCAVLFAENVISAIVPEEELPTSIEIDFDLDGGTLVPGFVELQVNGGGGVLFTDAPTVDGIRTIGAAHRQFGTTGFMPTLITTDFGTMRRAIRAVDDAIEADVPGVLGIHLEGPFLNVARKCAHDHKQFQVIDDEAIELLTSLKHGKTIVTIAPENTTTEVIEHLTSSGVFVAAGHSAANYEQTLAAIEAGVTGFTHLFNAMNPMLHREPGMVGAAITDRTCWFGIIADGFHVHPTALQIAVSAKYQGGSVLVTDAMPVVGSETNAFELGGEIIRSVDGRCINSSGSLAGSDLTMIDAVNNTAKFARLDWFEAVRMASLYPARAIEVDRSYGQICPGRPANMVAVSAKRSVVRTWIDGDGI